MNKKAIFVHIISISQLEMNKIDVFVHVAISVHKMRSERAPACLPMPFGTARDLFCTQTFGRNVLDTFEPFFVPKGARAKHGRQDVENIGLEFSEGFY